MQFTWSRWLAGTGLSPGFIGLQTALIWPASNTGVSKGKCYEIYGLDKAGKKVEIYFDPATGVPMETK